MNHFYFAPMEGITGYVFRNAYHSCFPGIAKYFTPFLAPDKNCSLHPREKNDVLLEHNNGIPLIPQILTNNPEHFIKCAQTLQDMGYQEINLNLGCPSGTVVAKGRGAGFLADRASLASFLDKIIANTTVSISIKTRIGIEHADEFAHLLRLYNQYPLKELIIHPRLLKDYYKNTPDCRAFAQAVSESRHPLCYNGDIFSQEDFIRIKAMFPTVDTFMLGRGLLMNPFLVQSLLQNTSITDLALLCSFHNLVYKGYQQLLSGDKNVLFKMKELWFYFIQFFPNAEKLGKKIKKAERLTDYEQIVDSIFMIE